MGVTLTPILFFDINLKISGIHSATPELFNMNGKTIEHITKDKPCSLSNILTNSGKKEYMLEIGREYPKPFIQFTKLH